MRMLRFFGSFFGRVFSPPFEEDKTILGERDEKKNRNPVGKPPARKRRERTFLTVVFFGAAVFFFVAAAALICKANAIFFCSINGEGVNLRVRDMEHDFFFFCFLSFLCNK